MKITLMLSAMIVMAIASLASAADFGQGYFNRLRESHRGPAFSSEYVYLNAIVDYEGPGRVESCSKVSTYQGGPKGSWRTYYICKVVIGN
jgi:hypothetical protein